MSSCYNAEPFRHGEYPLHLLSPSGVIDRIADLSREELEAVVEVEENAAAWHDSIAQALLSYLSLLAEVAVQVEQGFDAAEDQVVEDPLGLRRGLARMRVARMTEGEITQAKRIYLEACEEDNATAASDHD